MTPPENIYIGTASWNLPKDFANVFGQEGSHLERYSRLFNAVEINSSFYREHKAVTYAKWADTVPEKFKFSVKLWKYFTHELKLKVDEKILKENLFSVSHLGAKWGVLLIQLPPSLALDPQTAESFFFMLRQHYQGVIAFEPRHISWTQQAGYELMQKFQISKVSADPEPCPLRAELKSKACYYRLHGSPEIYKSAYDLNFIKAIFTEMKKSKSCVSGAWCIFDNTTFGFATKNALEMRALKSPNILTAELSQ